LEESSPECLRGILAFGYFGKQHQDIGRECLLGCRARGERVGFGLFTLALLFAYGGDKFSHLDMRFALGLLGEASAAGCSIATEWQLRLLLSPASIDLPRMDISDAEWNDYEQLSQERLKEKLSFAFQDEHHRPSYDLSPSVGKKEASKNQDIKAMMAELEDARRHNRRNTRALYDPALALRLALEQDPGWNSAILDLIVDALWREGKFHDALKLIKRGAVLGANWALEDTIVLALRETSRIPVEQSSDFLDAREEMLADAYFKPALLLAADEVNCHPSIQRVVEALVRGEGIPRDPSLARLIKERAARTEQEEQTGGAMSTEEIDSLLKGL
jgi:hypothetical protein